MKQAQCPICNKWIEGFTVKDLKYKMLMHNITHRDKSEENQKEETEQCHQ